MRYNEIKVTSGLYERIRVALLYLTDSKNLTRLEISLELSCPQSWVTNIIAGNKIEEVTTINYLIKLAKSSDLKLGYLLNGVEQLQNAVIPNLPPYNSSREDELMNENREKDLYIQKLESTVKAQQAKISNLEEIIRELKLSSEARKKIGFGTNN